MTCAAGSWSRGSRPAGPAEKAGIRKGDEIVGVGGEAPRSLADFYRKVWATGTAGATVPLDVEQGGAKRRIDVQVDQPARSSEAEVDAVRSRRRLTAAA